MNEAVVRRTQESLGRVIRKPPMSERLLNKPPFRYLHDVITEVIRVTGFMKGLYTDFELKSDNVKDKDAKISFLQKAIDTVVMVTGEPLSVKPARVVAGHEPEKTNEFLQAIGKCCLNKLSSDVAVKKVLAGERPESKGKPPSSKSQDKEIRESTTEEQKKHREKEDRRDTEIKDRSSSRDRKHKGDLKESEKKKRESDKQKDNEDRHKDSEKDTFKEAEKQEKERNRSRATKQERETEKNKGKGDTEREDDLAHGRKGQEREKNNEGGREKGVLKGRDKDKSRDREREKDGDRGKDREKERQRDREKDGEHLKEHRKEKAEKKSADFEESMLRRTQKPTKDSKCQPDDESESPAGISRQPSTKGSRQRAKPGGEGIKETKSVADKISEHNIAKLQEEAEPEFAVKQKEGEAENVAPEKPAVYEDGEVPNDVPPQPIQRRIPRPSSARPAPPRVKRQESAEVLLPERSGSGKTVSNVIVEQHVSADEDDEFVVESAVLLPEMTEMEMEPEVELVEDEKHGGLVKRLLETKKDYEASKKSSKVTDREKPLVLEADRKKERDLVAKEIEKFQVSIQTLCRSALSLGRIMDYIQEDMDAMKNELQMWRQENRQHAETLQKEQSITDSAVEPLKAELAELEQLIKDQQDKNCAVKASILKNEDKIQRMVLNRNVSSRR